MKKVFLSISKVALLFAVLLPFITSCESNNDYNVLGFDSSLLEFNSKKNNWMSQLTLNLSDNSKVLYTSGVSLLETELLDDIVVDSLDFIYNKEICFPAYYKSFDRFDPVPFSFIEKGDSVMTHVSANHIRDMVNSIIVDQDEFTFVMLTWSCDGDFKFKTIAVFDKEFGELVYDNLLSNLIDNETLKSKSKQISRGEGSNSPKYEEFSISTTFNKPTLGEGTYKIDIDVLGHTTRTVRKNGNDSIIGYWIDWYSDGIDIEESQSGTYYYYQHDHHLSQEYYGRHRCEVNIISWIGESMPPIYSFATTAINQIVDFSASSYSAKMLQYRLYVPPYPVSF